MREKFTSCLALSACAAFVAATNTLASGMTGWISGGGHAGNGIPPPGEVRYLAANGSDANDGKSPETAWRTVERLNSGLPSGGTALLRCGDVFYGTVMVPGGVDRDRRTVVTSFGSGPKPVISCTKNLRDAPAIWQPHSKGYNQWYVDLTDPSNYTGLASANANPGFLIVDGEVKPWKRFSRHDVNAQWDFAGEDGRLYIHSTNNPALLAHDIRVAVNVHGMRLFSHTAVSNLAVRATGAHGMQSTPVLYLFLSMLIPPRDRDT